MPFRPSRRQLLTGSLAGLTLPSQARARRLRVGFVNPGRTTDGFWQMADRLMRTAADHFDIDLVVRRGERDRQRIIVQGRELIDQGLDYLAIVNEHRTAVPLANAAMEAGTPCLLVFSGLAADDIAILGRPRERSPLLLGSLVADNMAAGAAMARGLLSECRRLRRPERTDAVPLLAIAGPAATPAGQERSDGLRLAVAADGNAVVLDHVSLNWSREQARSRVISLLRRQPQTEGIWCANDDMALGALDGAAELGFKTGIDLALVGMNWQTDALREVAAGRIALSMGGHFLLGAWALAWLRDHADGRDFAAAGGAEQRLSLAPLDRQGADRYLARFGDDGWSRIDFSRLRQRRGAYDLQVTSVLAV
ncbi:ABC transporter substrate-binding protein [Niveispirillum fermenti]|uniref:ABC transporter substrate-binding protein n=1 Tax=Niveispirillum fermenti TaxID=1233113 RepID=UPI003A8C70D2